jgi:trans-2,3-dihydro-3-hydroxyanthranilate isomerase
VLGTEEILFTRNRCQANILKTMEANKNFVVVNAFADGPFGGNPAAVFPDADGLSPEVMQALARQLNLVETVFVLPAEKGANFKLRYFTPLSEIPVAGHPSIAAWRALIHKGIITKKDGVNYTQENLAGTQEININWDSQTNPVITMKQPQAEFIEHEFSRKQVATVFGIEESDIHPDLPIKGVNTGLGHIIVPLRSMRVLKVAQRNIELLGDLCRSAKLREAQLFCFETLNKTYNLHTRNLCPRQGLEDPACGIGNGALTAYISKYHWKDKAGFNLKNEQGTVVKMPSVIHTRSVSKNGNLEIFVGGAGTVMLEGQVLADLGAAI